ncbi:hypothetical protein IWX90DRAFT_513211 [Phyllosticta citrichinensis]|uniref:Uncharacterized protein n=1 Tax=Phyllosticta citrichinensis TaxID=1130410 RepID=A0ABR1XXC2_9PEZI
MELQAQLDAEWMAAPRVPVHHESFDVAGGEMASPDGSLMGRSSSSREQQFNEISEAPPAEPLSARDAARAHWARSGDVDLSRQEVGDAQAALGKPQAPSGANDAMMEIDLRIYTLASELDKLVDGLVAAKSQLGTASGEQCDVKRKTIIDLAGQIISETQQPRERMFDYIAQAGEMGALRTLMEWNAFDMIPYDGSVSCVDLVAKLNSDEVLVRRLCWMLAARGLLRLVGDDAVAHTKHSQVAKYRNPHAAFFRLSYDVLGKSAPAWPTYFEK